VSLRWSSRLAVLSGVLSLFLHAGFYLSPFKTQFLRQIYRIEYLPVAIASRLVSVVFPACFPTMRQIVLFEVLVLALATSQGFLLGFVIDAFTHSRSAKEGSAIPPYTL